jgi:putative ABC transport system ATP-binding protein
VTTTKTTTTAAVTVDRVKKVYGAGHTAVTALDDVSLSLGDGEFLALVGPSGSGKTTLLSIIGALLRPTHGRVLLGEVDLTALPLKRQTSLRAERIGFVFQSFDLVPFLTARENLTLMAALAGNSTRAAGRRADELLDELGLAERAGHLPEALSGGERQRVAIGRALVNDPGLLLVDEPTANLDTDRGLQVVELLAGQIKRHRKAGIMVTHDRRMAGHADRVLELLDGRLVHPGPQPSRDGDPGHW